MLFSIKWYYHADAKTLHREHTAHSTDRNTHLSAICSSVSNMSKDRSVSSSVFDRRVSSGVGPAKLMADVMPYVVWPPLHTTFITHITAESLTYTVHHCHWILSESDCSALTTHSRHVNSRHSRLLLKRHPWTTSVQSRILMITRWYGHMQLI